MLVRPPGTFTTAEYADKRGLDRNNAKSHLERLQKLGKVKRITVPGGSRIYWQII